MQKIVIFGNSGSGKSTLAKKISRAEGLSHLDLDTIAWKPRMPPERKPMKESGMEVSAFIKSNSGWVIEGGYSDLLEIAIPFSSEVIFMKLPVESCIRNAKNRPWEPHKYKSKEAQDKYLDLLLDWISQYTERTDTFSERAHYLLYEKFKGDKKIVTSNTNCASPRRR